MFALVGLDYLVSWNHMPACSPGFFSPLSKEATYVSLLRSIIIVMLYGRVHSCRQVEESGAGGIWGFREDKSNYVRLVRI